MEVSVYNMKGVKTGKEKLNSQIFDVKVKVGVLHRVVEAQLANRRSAIAATKGRSQVRGGGRKPWKQKGTGRARAGSTRSPIWKGGGVTFGPTSARNFKKRINKKEKRTALLMALTSKAQDKKIVVIDDFKLEKIKTKPVATLLSALSLNDKSALIALAKKDDKVAKSVANLSDTKTGLAGNLNAHDVLRYDTLLLAKDSLKVIEKTFLS